MHISFETNDFFRNLFNKVSSIHRKQQYINYNICIIYIYIFIYELTMLRYTSIRKFNSQSAN